MNPLVLEINFSGVSIGLVNFLQNCVDCRVNDDQVLAIMQEFLIIFEKFTFGIAVVVKLVLDVFENIISILDLVGRLYLTSWIVFPGFLEGTDISLEAENHVIVDAFPEDFHTFSSRNRLGLVFESPLELDLLLEHDQAPLLVMLLHEGVLLLWLQLLEFLLELKPEPLPALGLVVLNHAAVGLAAVSNEVVLLFLKHREVVLDLGVVSDVGVLVQGEQVDHQAVHHEAKGEAKEEGLSVQELDDVSGPIQGTLLSNLKDLPRGPKSSPAGSKEPPVRRESRSVQCKQCVVHFLISKLTVFNNN